MKQILQHLKNGKTELMDVPAPSLSDQKIIIESTQSLLSLGTEKMLVDFGSANILNKALKQPDRVKQVLSKLQFFLMNYFRQHIEENSYNFSLIYLLLLLMWLDTYFFFPFEVHIIF